MKGRLHLDGGRRKKTKKTGTMSALSRVLAVLALASAAGCVAPSTLPLELGEGPTFLLWFDSSGVERYRVGPVSEGDPRVGAFSWADDHRLVALTHLTPKLAEIGAGIDLQRVDEVELVSDEEICGPWWRPGIDNVRVSALEASDALELDSQTGSFGPASQEILELLSPYAFALPARECPSASAEFHPFGAVGELLPEGTSSVPGTNLPIDPAKTERMILETLPLDADTLLLRASSWLGILSRGKALDEDTPSVLSHDLDTTTDDDVNSEFEDFIPLGDRTVGVLLKTTDREGFLGEIVFFDLSENTFREIGRSKTIRTDLEAATRLPDGTFLLVGSEGVVFSATSSDASDLDVLYSRQDKLGDVRSVGDSYAVAVASGVLVAKWGSSTPAFEGIDVLKAGSLPTELSTTRDGEGLWAGSRDGGIARRESDGTWRPVLTWLDESSRGCLIDFEDHCGQRTGHLTLSLRTDPRSVGRGFVAYQRCSAAFFVDADLGCATALPIEGVPVRSESQEVIRTVGVGEQSLYVAGWNGLLYELDLEAIQ